MDCTAPQLVVVLKAMIRPPTTLTINIRIPAINLKRILRHHPLNHKISFFSNFCSSSFASSGVRIPALRSASMAICFPGNASNVNRAETSETRPAPLVITTKLITKIENTNIPTAYYRRQ